MTGSSEYLHNLHSYDGNQKIQIVHGNTLSITDVCDINSNFRDVLVSPGLPFNLLFVCQLVDNNCSVNFSRNGCLVQRRCWGMWSQKGLKWEDCFQSSLFPTSYLVLIALF
jgi:hypothetical protein